MSLAGAAAELLDRLANIGALVGRVSVRPYRSGADGLRIAARSLESADAFRPSDREKAMQTLASVKPKPLTGESGGAFVARTESGARSLYKPGLLENMPLIPFPTHLERNPPVLFSEPRRCRYGIPFGGGHLAARAVSAYRLAEALGFELVPPTGFANGPFGRGSNQLWVAARESYPARAARKFKDEISSHTPSGSDLERWLENRQWEKQGVVAAAHLLYPKYQREQMAVVDYIIANTDRNHGNLGTDDNGGIVALDHDLSFPEAPDSFWGIRSEFVKEFRYLELSSSVLEAVRAVDREWLRAGWIDAGLSDTAISGAFDRLQEICDHSRIIGAAWPGPINGAILLPDLRGLPVGW